MRITHAASAALLAATALASTVHAAPLSYTGGGISNNFNGLPTNVTNPSQVLIGKGPHEFSVITGATGMEGWQLGNFLGSSTSTEFRSQNGATGSSGGRGVLSLGTDGSTERALGSITTSNQIGSFGLVLVNNSATTFESFNLSFTGEQWRRGEAGVNNSMNFAYGLAPDIDDNTLTNVAALSFSNPNTQSSPTEVALDGNLPANQVALSGSITGLNWAPGQTLVLRWTMDQVQGQDNGLAIDDLTFSAVAVPEPSTLVLGTVALAGLGVRSLRRRRAAKA